MASELSRRLVIDRIAPAGVAEETVRATADECVAVAARLQIPAVLRLECRFRLRRPGGGAVIQADGALRARVTRECVLSLEPFDTDVAEDFSVRFVPAGTASEDDDPFAPDELLHDGVSLDLGEAAVEQLALALEPYPRSPDAIWPDPEERPAVAEAEAQNPFAALDKFRSRH